MPGFLDLLKHLGQGTGGVLEGAGRGVLGGVEDFGRSLIGQQPQALQGWGGMNPEQLKAFIPDDAMRAAVLHQIMPTTQSMLGPVGRIPVLGQVLGGTLDVLSTLQAARKGGLGQELAHRGLAGAIPFTGLEKMAEARKAILEGETEKGRKTLLDTQGGEIADRIRRNNDTTDGRLKLLEAQRITQDAATETQKAAAKAHEAQAWADYQRGTAAGLYPGELPVGADPSTIQIINGKPVVGASPGHGPIVLPNAPAPGKAGGGAADKPLPTNLKTREQLLAIEGQLPPGQKLIASEAPGRSLNNQPLYTYQTVPIGQANLAKRTEAAGKLREMIPNYFAGGNIIQGSPSWTGRPTQGMDLNDPLRREQAQGLLQQATGRPIPIGPLLDERGYLSQEKLDKALSEAQDDETNKNLFLGWKK